MEKTKLLTFAVIGLLLLNLSTIGFLYMKSTRYSHPERHPLEGRGPEGNRPKPDKIIIQKLHFDKEQQEQYQKLIQWHRGQINSLETEIHDAKNRLYTQLLKQNVDSETKDSLIDALANYQKQIETTHFKHFQDIKALCREEQLEDFYNLTEELSRIFSKPPKPRDD